MVLMLKRVISHTYIVNKSGNGKTLKKNDSFFHIEIEYIDIIQHKNFPTKK